MVKYDYTAYGEIVEVYDNTNYELSKINPFRYKGYYYDEETGWFWLSSRYYSLELCRFISSDYVDYLEPESINGLNLYAYAKNNLIMFYDPSGYSVILVIGLLVGFFIVGAGARNSANIASSMKLTGKGASAVKAITIASNRYLAGEISMKGLQATTRLWGNVALNAVQDAIAPTIRSIMIKSTIAITG